MLYLAICDDEKADRIKLEAIIKNYMEGLEKSYAVHIFRSGEELLASTEKYDVIFLDIALTGINGIQAGKMLRNQNRNTRIIYTTNFHQYCKQAMNQVHAFAYLEKPVTMDKVKEQMDEILHLVDKEKEKPVIVKFEVISVTEAGRVETKIKSFDVQDIYYFEYVNRKIRLKLKEEEYYFTGKMKNLIQKVQIYNFESCHQNYLVNLKFVSKIKGYDIYLEDKEQLPVSQKRSSDFRKKLNKFIQGNI